MQWTPEYIVQSGLWVILWLAGGAGVAKAVTARRRGR